MSDSAVWAQLILDACQPMRGATSMVRARLEKVLREYGRAERERCARLADEEQKACTGNAIGAMNAIYACERLAKQIRGLQDD